jgi:hypothetical protein
MTNKVSFALGFASAIATGALLFLFSNPSGVIASHESGGMGWMAKSHTVAFVGKTWNLGAITWTSPVEIEEGKHQAEEMREGLRRAANGLKAIFGDGSTRDVDDKETQRRPVPLEMTYIIKTESETGAMTQLLWDELRGLSRTTRQVVKWKGSSSEGIVYVFHTDGRVVESGSSGKDRYYSSEASYYDSYYYINN